MEGLDAQESELGAVVKYRYRLGFSPNFKRWTRTNVLLDVTDLLRTAREETNLHNVTLRFEHVLRFTLADALNRWLCWQGYASKLICVVTSSPSHSQINA